MARLHKPKAGLWIRFCVLVIYPLDGLLFKIRWCNLQRVPAKGGVILAVNHVSYVDTILIARFVWQSGRIPRFLIKASMFEKPFIGGVLRGAAQIPVRRGTADASQSLHAAKEALDRGECVIIYPEGTMTHDPDWWPARAKTGVARLALLAPHAPVVPVGQFGAQFTFDSLRKTVRPFPRKEVTVSVGEAVDLARFRDKEPTSELLHEMTDEIMWSITELVGEIRNEPPPPRLR
ncbi:MAG: lysophospholipid acyltransferase family protein [Jatrophihabitans sp.]